MNSAAAAARTAATQLSPLDHDSTTNITPRNDLEAFRKSRSRMSNRGQRGISSRFN